MNARVTGTKGLCVLEPSRGSAIAAIRSASPTCTETRRCPETTMRRNDVSPQVIARGSTARPDGQISTAAHCRPLSDHIGDSAIRQTSRTIHVRAAILSFFAVLNSLIGIAEMFWRFENNKAILILIERRRPTYLLSHFAQCSLSACANARGIDGVHFPGHFPRLRTPKSRHIRGNDGNNSPLTLPSPTAPLRFPAAGHLANVL